jgi:HD superfamily phosphohydrolase
LQRWCTPAAGDRRVTDLDVFPDICQKRQMRTPGIEVRCPIHGFIKLSEWERDVINHPVFQRLRRIRQLGWTDLVYPGAMHTRFEHSLGVMHTASIMFDAIVAKCGNLLDNQFEFNATGFEKDRQVLRLAALLHDVGHAPFSHAGEALMPVDAQTNQRFQHEDYSASAVRFLMKDVIDEHAQSQNFGITADQVADFIQGKATLGRQLLWRELLSGQFDADRADYLLRDSHHLGVAYGRYDLNRLIATSTIAVDDGTPRMAIERGGFHAAEALILARYFMFTQVYFQHTRRAFDYHFGETMGSLLSNASTGDLSLDLTPTQFPAPQTESGITEYLKWDDWRILGELWSNNGGPHGRILAERTHYIRIYFTPEVPTKKDIGRFDRIRNKLGERVQFIDNSTSSWYKLSDKDIRIKRRDEDASDALSTLSEVVKNMKSINQLRIYVDRSSKKDAKEIVNKIVCAKK